eukprot:symbB.v1.2.012080.t1/scaffold822.1/size350215/7
MRWDHGNYYSPEPDCWKQVKVCCNHTCMIDGLELFDAKFFRIAPAEVKGMDPLQRQILEVGYAALHDAGQTTKTLLQSLTAIYVASPLSEWPAIDAGPEESGGCAQRSAGTGIAGSIMSNRFSFVFGMNGPSITFDTDASSGLVILEAGLLALDQRRNQASHGKAQRMGPLIADYLTTNLEDRGFEVHRIDPLLAEQGVLLQFLKRSTMPKGLPLLPPLRRLRELSMSCDAFCLAAPEAEGEHPEVLDFLSYLGGAEVFGYKPWGICVYSMFSSPKRHVMLREALTKMQAVTVPEALHIPGVQHQFRGGVVEPTVDESCGRMLEQLEWYTRATRMEKEKH